MDTSKWSPLNAEIIACRRCPRLVAWREQAAAEKRRAFRDCDYWGRPVPGFGDHRARLLVIGLAPGAHGSNRTGRMFTGDASGEFLYAALHRAGFASQPNASHAMDGLKLRDVFITAVCRCAPPGNKPLPQEILNCRPFLTAEMGLLGRVQGVVALGQLAFRQALIVYQVDSTLARSFKFVHGAFYQMGESRPWLLASYHPSRQNTQTGRLSPEMFDAVWQKARRMLAGGSGPILPGGS